MSITTHISASLFVGDEHVRDVEVLVTADTKLTTLQARQILYSLYPHYSQREVVVRET